MAKRERSFNAIAMRDLQENFDQAWRKLSPEYTGRLQFDIGRYRRNGQASRDSESAKAVRAMRRLARSGQDTTLTHKERRAIRKAKREALR